MGAMKARAEMIEGQEAWERFHAAMKNVIAVPHAEIKKRIEAYKKQAALNPNKRGPKPKRKRASRVPAV